VTITSLLSKFKIPLIVLGLLFLIFLIFNRNTSKQVQYVIYKAEKIITGKDPDLEKAAQVSEAIQSSLKDKPGEYAVYVKDLKKDKAYKYKSNQIFASASLYKLAVMYTTFDEVEKGDLDMDETVSGDRAELDKILSGLEEEGPGQDQTTGDDEILAYPVSEALRLMITISDNYSAVLLAQKIGWANIDKFLKNQGVEDFDLTSDNEPVSKLPKLTLTD